MNTAIVLIIISKYASLHLLLISLIATAIDAVISTWEINTIANIALI